MAVDVTTALPGGDPARFLRNEPDEALVAHVLQGSEAAFEAIYDRHHRGLIAFCRHMLRSREEAEDALQHTFAAAYRSLTAGERPNALKAWLYTIARNRCLTVLRARRTREDAATAETPFDGAVVEGLSDAVQRRADLRDLVADLHRLPEDQRSALVLFELGDHSHAEIADVLSVDREKVKALVFQAREGLLRARTARDTPCAEIRHHLSSRTRALPRRGVIRGHLDCCPACAAYDLEVRRQRAALALVLPVVPSLELKGTVLSPLLGGGATVAAGGAAALGTGTAGTAVTGGGAGAAGAGAGAAGGAAGAGAAGGTLAVATGAGTGLTGGAAMTGLGALAANAMVAKVVTVVAVAGASLGAGHAIETMHHRSSGPATTLSAPAAVAAAPTPQTIAAPAAPLVHRPVEPTPPAAHPAPAATTATVASAPAASDMGATTASPAVQTGTSAADPTAQPGATPAQDPAPGAPAAATDPAPPADGGASGSAPADASPPSADPAATAANTADPNAPPTISATADPSSSAPPVTCPAGTAPVDPTVTPTTSVATTPTDPAAPPPVPTVTLPDGSTVPIPDGCVLVPPATTATAPAVSGAVAASDAPPTP
ncbi:MAG: hypothetical protein QOH72_3511 [Solirubrobacteraceae bacterium]|nr:hypothetical protein [Solirubrobacteraceae bacterium]